MKQLTTLMTFIFFSFMCISLSGCGDGQPPETDKSTIEKLNSNNPEEQSEGLDAAAEKFGGDQ